MSFRDQQKYLDVILENFNNHIGSVKDSNFDESEVAKINFNYDRNIAETLINFVSNPNNKIIPFIICIYQVEIKNGICYWNCLVNKEQNNEIGNTLCLWRMTFANQIDHYNILHKVKQS